MTALAAKVFFCLVLLTLARLNESQVETSTMSREEVEELIETMDSNYRPTPYERQMIFKYFLNPSEPSPSEDPVEPAAADEAEADYHSESTTELYELTTEPLTDEFVEVFQPTHEVVLPVQEHPSPVQEHPSSVQELYGQEHPVYYGSSRGIPGYNFPNYFDIPQTSFTCTEKDIIPGFYADLETGCQAFHVCWPHRRESFLCPVGTIFNQALLACDYWYNSNCSLAPHYYNVNAHAYHKMQSYQIHEESDSRSVISSMIDTLITKGEHDDSGLRVHAEPAGKEPSKTEPDLSYVMKFLPIKAKVTVYPETSIQKSKVVAEASVGKKKVVKPVYAIEKPAVQTYQYVPVKTVHTPSVSRIVDEIFTVAKKIVEESHGLASRMKDTIVEESHGLASRKKVEQAKVHKPVPVPLTKLNPRFITKPAPVEKIHEQPIKDSENPPQTKSKRVLLVKKLVTPAVRVETLKKVSPITRKALAGSYLKLLKTKGY